jgi:hypothetical protein
MYSTTEIGFDPIFGKKMSQIPIDNDLKKKEMLFIYVYQFRLKILSGADYPLPS